MSLGNYEPPIKAEPIDYRRRFTNEEVWELRRRFKAGETISSLAKEYSVSTPCMASAIRGTGTYENV